MRREQCLFESAQVGMLGRRGSQSSVNLLGNFLGLLKTCLKDKYFYGLCVEPEQKTPE